MATDVLPVTDGEAAGTHTYMLAAEGAAVEVVFDDQMTDASVWEPAVQDTGSSTAPPAAYSDAAAEDGAAVGSDFGMCYFLSTANVPYDGTSLYEVALRLRTEQAPTDTSFPPVVYAGLSGVAADGTTLINRVGEDNGSSQHYCVLSKRTVPEAPGYTTYYGYKRGWDASGSGAETPNPAAPGAMYDGSVYIRPIMYLNYRAADGIQYVDRVTVSRIAAPEVEPADYTITVTGDTTGHTATADVTITGLDTDGAVNAYNTGVGLNAQADITGLTSDTAVTLNWGDETARETLSLTDGAATATHEYAAAGTYAVSIIGTTSGTVDSNNATVGDVVQAPDNLAEASTPPPDADSFTVTWDAVDGASGYTATATGADGTAVPGTVEGTAASFTALDPATDYTVAVTALGDGGAGDSSPATTTVTTAEAP